MVAKVIQLRDINTGRLIASEQISSDAGSLARRDKAQNMCNRHSDERDCYVVELERETNGDLLVLNKYQL